MVKILILSLLLGLGSVYAKNSVGACVPIGKIVILKKAIMSLDLNKKQKEKLVTYEEELKDKLGTIRSDAFSKNERLSNLFSETTFLRKRFVRITTSENEVLTDAVASYFEKMYKVLSQDQKNRLVKRFKRIERQEGEK